ncbi:Beta-primeverosidase [Bertholletia excelsa]
MGYGVNQKDVESNNNLIDEILANDLFVTLLHWDLPQALDDYYGGFLLPKIVIWCTLIHFYTFALIRLKEQHLKTAGGLPYGIPSPINILVFYLYNFAIIIIIFQKKIRDHSNGDVADDFYHRYKEDIALVKSTGFDAFRFSISWSRVIPKGKISYGVNQKGVEFYNNLIDEILANGLKPYVTLFHWDLPQALDDYYGGFLSPKIVDDYVDYADFCFRTFGDRVKNWFTLNEPYEYSVYGYATDVYPPGRCSSYIGNCTAGNSATEPYIVGHHLILSHAAAVKLYREKYKHSQKGEIGIALSSWWYVPISQNKSSQVAAMRGLDFRLGWFLHPLTYGDYPRIMKKLLRSRLPRFLKADREILMRSYDFVGINYYTSKYAANRKFCNTVNLTVTTDNCVLESVEKNGVPIGQPTGFSTLYSYPKGIEALMIYVKDYYGNPPIYITENGYAQANNNTLPVAELLKDEARIVFHHDHLFYLSKAIKEGARVKGYFMWSFLDDYEWDVGYTVRFGTILIDYKDGLKRYPKDSALWFKKFLQKS